MLVRSVRTINASKSWLRPWNLTLMCFTQVLLLYVDSIYHGWPEECRSHMSKVRFEAW